VGGVHGGHPRRDLRPHRQEEEVPGNGASSCLRLRNELGILRLFFAERELDLVKKRESRTDQREVLGAIIAENITLAGEAVDPDAPRLKTKKARTQLERDQSELLVSEGDELTEEVFNRLRRLKIDKIKVFASYTTIDLRDEMDAIERGERPERRVIARDAVNTDSGEVIAECGDKLTDTLIKKLRKAEINKVQVFVTSGRAESALIKNTIAKDPTHTEEEALRQIYSLLRPGDAPNRETAKQALERLFFSPKRYDLGRVGRYKINQRLGTTVRRARQFSLVRISSRSSATS
jgi:DNA-directed RNA polymerase subunit beta